MIYENNIHWEEQDILWEHGIMFPDGRYFIVDPFMWSWTTAVACKSLWRKFIGSEINPKYCEIANRRISDLFI